MKMKALKNKQPGQGNGTTDHKQLLFTPEEAKLLAPLLDQHPPITNLAISQLNVDLSYQERPRERIVHQVATQLTDALLNVFVVAQRPDGSYWVMDGESRRQGILRRGEKHREVRCLVFQTQGREQEALMWAVLNSKRTREPIKLVNRFIAYHVAGTDKGFIATVEKCGYNLVGKTHRTLGGPYYVFKAWQLDGNGSVMQKALFAVNDNWRDKYKIDGYMVLGIARLYHMVHRTVDDQVRRVLHRMSPSDIMDKVTKRWAMSGGKTRIHPDEKPRLISRVLADEINRNPGKGGKIDIRALAEDAEEAHP